MAPDKFAPDNSKLDKSKRIRLQFDQSIDPTTSRLSGTPSPSLSISMLQFSSKPSPGSKSNCSTSATGSNTIIPFVISHCIPETNELSSICPLAHHPALFLIQSGMTLTPSSVPCSVDGMVIIPFVISHCIPETNELSSICPLAHHPALFLIQSGIVAS